MSLHSWATREYSSIAKALGTGLGSQACSLRQVYGVLVVVLGWVYHLNFESHVNIQLNLKVYQELSILMFSRPQR